MLLMKKRSRPSLFKVMGKRSPTLREAPKVAKSGKSGATSCNDDDNNKEVDDSDEEHIADVERDFRHKAQQPNDHFEKLLKATYPNHAYPVKHKLKECTMMKNYMASWALSKGKNPEGDLGERSPPPSVGKRLSCRSTVDSSPTNPNVNSSLQAGRLTQ
jgi:hypothetical protein